MKIKQLQLITAMMAEVSRQSKEAGEADLLESFQMNALIDGANLAVERFNREAIRASDNTGLKVWLASDDVGMSSKFMAHVLAGGPKCEFAYPHDPADFNRCVKFLRAVPEARKKLNLLTSHEKPWPELVARWPELESLLDKEITTGRSTELYKLMEGIGC